MDFYVSDNKALILAAGLGTRLAPITNDRPKSLVPVNGKPILLKQIENLKLNGIVDITIVSGYKADALEAAVHEKYPEIKIVESVDYATTNNMYSAYLGIKAPTLRSWIKNPKNEVPAHKVGRLWKFKRSEIDDWVNSGKSAIAD